MALPRCAALAVALVACAIPLAHALAPLVAHQGFPPAQCNKVLFVLSSSDHLTLKDGLSTPAGNYFNEVTVPARVLTEAGFIITYASPKGTGPYFDGRLSVFFKSVPDFKASEAFVRNWTYTRTLDSVSNQELNEFSAIFIPGGNAVLEDLGNLPSLGRILNHFHAASKLTAVICNAAYALLSTGEYGAWPYWGYQMTVFSDEEWFSMQPMVLAQLTHPTPGQMLKAQGAILNQGLPMSSHVVEDRELLSGQNPWSSFALAKIMAYKLEQCGGR